MLICLFKMCLISQKVDNWIGPKKLYPFDLEIGYETVKVEEHKKKKKNLKCVYRFKLFHLIIL